MTELASLCTAFGIDAAAARQALADQHGAGQLGAPWYVLAILGVGAWITALAIIGFVAAILFLGFEHEEPDALTAGVGAALFILGLAIGRRHQPLGFAGQFATALAAAGLIVAAASLGIERESWTAATAVAAIGALAVILQGRDALLQFLCSGLAAWLGVGAAVDADLPHLIDLLSLGLPIGVALYLCPPRLDMRPTAAVLLLMMPLLSILKEGWLLGGQPADGWTARAISVAVLLALIGLHGRKLPSPNPVVLAALALLAGAVDLLLPPGGGAALAIMMLAFVLGSWPLAIIGTLLEVLFIWQFYYDLDATLLTKSFWLMGVGAALLAAYAMLLHGDRGGAQP
jgi:hypothetical protein